MRLRLVIGWKRMPSSMATICRRNQSIWTRKSTISEYMPATGTLTPIHTSAETQTSAMCFWLFSAFVFVFFFLCSSPKIRTKCCYGLSMDLLDNVATELGFEFHLYVVRDQLFGAKKTRSVHDHLANRKQSVNQQSPSIPPTMPKTMSTHSADYKLPSADGQHEINHADIDNREYTTKCKRFGGFFFTICTHRYHWNDTTADANVCACGVAVSDSLIQSA